LEGTSKYERQRGTALDMLGRVQAEAFDRIREVARRILGDA
jgi:hypothetical protein